MRPSPPSPCNRLRLAAAASGKRSAGEDLPPEELEEVEAPNHVHVYSDLVEQQDLVGLEQPEADLYTPPLPASGAG